MPSGQRRAIAMTIKLEAGETWLRVMLAGRPSTVCTAYNRHFAAFRIESGRASLTRRRFVRRWSPFYPTEKSKGRWTVDTIGLGLVRPNDRKAADLTLTGSASSSEAVRSPSLKP